MPARNRLGEDELAAWAGLLKTHAALVPVLDRLVRRRAGLPLAWYDVLLELYQAPGRRLLMNELGERVVLSRSRVSRVVDELVDESLVRKIPHPKDGRASYAAITATGTSVFRRAAPIYLSGIAEHFGRHLTRSEAAAMHAALQRVLTARDPRRSAAGIRRDQIAAVERRRRRT